MTKRNIITISVIVVVVSVSIFLFLRAKTWPALIVVNGHILDVEVADNTVLLARGLSGHSKLLPNEGMLFIFQKPDNYGFWMKDMTFPIDIVWMDSSYRVVHIEKSLDPATYPKIYHPDSPSMYVLEVLAGQSDALNIRLGTQVEFSEKK